MIPQHAEPLFWDVNLTVVRGTPVPLFPTRPGSMYAASPGGQRFLVYTALEDTVTPPMTMILNWVGRKR